VAGRRDEQAMTVPVVEERAVVRKRKRITGAVLAQTVVHDREEVLDVPVEHEELVVERVTLDRLLDAPASVRQEGDTTVIPVHEEVLVVEKRLKLVGEVRVTRRRTTRQESHRVVLRREEVDVKRDAIADDPASA
jgi:uncharacterized protein (TIGR02271 family)